MGGNGGRKGKATMKLADGERYSLRHYRACPGNLDSQGTAFLSEMAGTSPAMTGVLF
jgi:hypothetical protein